MQKIYCLLFCLNLSAGIFSQHVPVNSQQFFLDDSIVNVTLTTDLKQLRSQKNKPKWQPANIEMHFSNTAVISEQVRIEQRGVDRKTHCDLAALMLNFKNKTSPLLSPRGRLKIVGRFYNGKKKQNILLK